MGLLGRMHPLQLLRMMLVLLLRLESMVCLEEAELRRRLEGVEARLLLVDSIRELRGCTTREILATARSLLDQL